MTILRVTRREFVAALGSAAAWPVVGRAQQPVVPVVGVLSSRSADGSADLIAAFCRGLGEAGFVEGRNVSIEFRWAEGHYDRLPTAAADLVVRQVAVIAALGGTPAVLAAKAATAKIPIVFITGADPVQFGLVSSLSRPGGNLTGVAALTSTLAPKLLELLHETVPSAPLVALLINPKNPNAETDRQSVKSAADTTRQQILVLSASTESELDDAFAALAQQHAGSVLVQSDGFFNDRPREIVALAARYAIPALYQWREFAATGGLMSYGTDPADAYRQVGVYTGRVLNGAQPSDLPVQQSVKVRMVVNLKTAKTLGITLPLSLLARADEVIE
jgi:putative tryptophan/tyrosine transport system substrate-binding protein